MAKGKRKAHQSTQENKRQKEDGNRRLDQVFGQYRALPVAQEVLDSVTDDTVPMDGETYLAMVRKQAEKGSSVMFISSGTTRTEEETITTTTTPHPPTATQEPFRDLTEFKDLVIKEYELQKQQLPEIGALEIPSDFVFPENFTSWRAYVMSHPPEIALISNFDVELTLKLIIYATRWLSPNTPSQIAKWIYALLVRVPSLLINTDVSTVRELGLRAKKLHDRDELAQDTRILCATILCIVGGVFDQTDLLR